MNHRIKRIFSSFLAIIGMIPLSVSFLILIIIAITIMALVINISIACEAIKYAFSTIKNKDEERQIIDHAIQILDNTIESDKEKSEKSEEDHG